MTKSALISHIAAKLGVPKATARRLIEQLVMIAIREVKKNRVFALPGLGQLFKSHRKARSGRSPQTRSFGQIPARFEVVFRVSKQAMERILGKEPGGFYVGDMRFAADEEISASASAGWADERANSDDRDDDRPGSGDYGGRRRRNPTTSPSREPSHSVVRVYYATDREPTSKNPLHYGSRRSVSGELYLGTCDVSIPRDHRMAKIERPSILRLEFSENPEKHFVIKEITQETSDEFYLDLSKRVAESNKKEALVFIHGFRVAFNDAVYRTAQIAYDLGFPGAPVLYSWPSNGKLYEYTGDLNNNDWTVDHLRGFLGDLASRSGARVIHLIAHSMGNRALLNALRLLLESKPTPVPHFNQIILTAPDIDADVFMRIAKVIQGSAERITLYASTRDKALAASKKLNGSYPRAGDCSSSVAVVPGVDTIDASAVDTNLIGHFYYAENRSVLSDVFNLLRDGGPPPRFGIRIVDVTPPYWRFVP